MNIFLKKHFLATSQSRKYMQISKRNKASAISQNKFRKPKEYITSLAVQTFCSHVHVCTWMHVTWVARTEALSLAPTYFAFESHLCICPSMDIQTQSRRCDSHLHQLEGKPQRPLYVHSCTTWTYYKGSRQPPPELNVYRNIDHSNILGLPNQFTH